MIRIILAGVCGYGAFHLRYFFDRVIDSKRYQLAAVVDPFVKNCPSYAELVKYNIPMYEDFTACLEEVKPDMAILCTPIDLHKPQILECFSRGIHVLCEKPLAATIADMEELKAARDAYGLKLGVGFQWSFCDTIWNLKQDIKNGVLGRPIHLKTMVSWQRAFSYYRESPWKGRINNAKGFPIHDSILTNATAHYMHNMLFIVDDEAADYEALTARANPIETFDTAFIHGSFKKGGEFTYVVSHCADTNHDPIFTYVFENATVTYDSNQADRIYATFKDGTIKEYGPVNTLEMLFQKNDYLAHAIECPEEPIRCSVEQVVPFAAICEEVFAHPETFREFDKEKVHFTNEMYQMDGLYEIMWNCFNEGRMPSQAEKNCLGIE